MDERFEKLLDPATQAAITNQLDAMRHTLALVTAMEESKRAQVEALEVCAQQLVRYVEAAVLFHRVELQGLQTQIAGVRDSITQAESLVKQAPTLPFMSGSSGGGRRGGLV